METTLQGSESAENGWYDFPGTNQIKEPVVICQ
jgi:hypothetical protein